MQLDVTVQIEGEDVLAGRLYQNVRHGDETATFSYAASYLDDARAFTLAPDMPLGPGTFHSEGLRDFRALEDCMPDRWGRNLMLRAERARAREDERVPRTLFEADMLAGVNDEARQGALRIWDADGRVLSGVAFGFFGIWVLKRFSFNMGQGATIFMIAVPMVAYALPSVLPGYWAGNGYLSVYLCGILLGNARIPKKRDCVRFFDALTGVAQMVIFFLLGLLATPEWLIRPQVLLPALFIFVFLTLAARPVAVSSLLLPFRAKANQIFVVSWAGLRGVASVVFAVYALGVLGEQTLPYDLYSIVFCVVLLSMLVQGTLLPLVSGKSHMLAPGGDVLRTFNDYQEEGSVSFVKIVVGENHPWAGKKLKSCVMPREFLVVLIVRGEEVVVPNGETQVNAGDLLVTAAPEFENREEFGMYEEFVGDGHAYVGKKIKDLSLPQGVLIAMIKRGGGTVIPYGATVVQSADTLVCIRLA